jgi:hypothetical protein
MSWSRGVRQVHRGLSVALTVAVVVNLVALGQQEPSLWVGLLALLPLAFLGLTEIDSFVLPYTAKGRSGRRAA